jgi:hypothetical protein
MSLDSSLEVPLRCDVRELTQLGTDNVSVRVLPFSVQFIYLIRSIDFAYAHGGAWAKEG